MSMIDIETVERLPAGDALVSLAGAPAQVAFQVRERSAVIRYLGKTSVEVRGGAFPVGEVVVVAVLLRCGQYVTREYATFWNFFHPRQRACFEAMEEQEIVSVSFFGDIGRQERSFIVVNPLKSFFAGLLRELSSRTPWSAESFQAAQGEVLHREAPLWEKTVVP